jgi:DNA-binding CsgD family transcriptional regulator
VTAKKNGAELLPKERSILDMVSHGAKNAEIADRLHYSLPWVKYYVSRLMRGFGARNRAELAVMASRLGIEPLQAQESYRVTHIDGLTPVLGDSRGAQFQVWSGETSVRIVIRVDQALAMSIDLH